MRTFEMGIGCTDRGEIAKKTYLMICNLTDPKFRKDAPRCTYSFSPSFLGVSLSEFRMIQMDQFNEVYKYFWNVDAFV